MTLWLAHLDVIAFLEGDYDTAAEAEAAAVNQSMWEDATINVVSVEPELDEEATRARDSE